MKVLFATTNSGKLGELRALVDEALEVVSLDEVPPIAPPVEDAETFEGNAEKKARYYAEATGLAALADDSGLCVDALGGGPGVHSARYAPGSDAARVAKLLEAMRDVPEERRKARFECALCLALPADGTYHARGTCEGVIVQAPRGEHGFGYDPVFLIPGRGRTLAELTRDEKSAISHRGEALRRLLPVLLAYARGTLGDAGQ